MCDVRRDRHPIWGNRPSFDRDYSIDDDLSGHPKPVGKRDRKQVTLRDEVAPDDALAEHERKAAAGGDDTNDRRKRREFGEHEAKAAISVAQTRVGKIAAVIVTGYRSDIVSVDDDRDR